MRFAPTILATAEPAILAAGVMGFAISVVVIGVVLTMLT